MLKYKSNTKEALERTVAFWNRENTDRCNLSITVPRKNPKVIPPEREYTLKDRFTDPKCIMNRCLNNFEKNEYLYEAFPIARTQIGTSAHCSYFGSKATYESNSVWWSEVLDRPDASLLQFDEAAFERHKQFTRGVIEMSGDQCLVSMNDNCRCIDALAALRGTENLLTDMLAEPDFVHEALDRIIPIWKKTQNEFCDMLQEKNFGGSSLDWMGVWSPKRHVQLQCDFSVMISPAMYEEFVLPELEEMASAFDHCTYHLDGIEQIRHLDMILSVKKIEMIQWTWVAGQPKPAENIETLQKIQKAGKGLLLMPGSDLKDIEFLLKNLSPKGLQLTLWANSAEQAEAIEKMARECAKVHL